MEGLGAARFARCVNEEETARFGGSQFGNDIVLAGVQIPSEFRQDDEMKKKSARKLTDEFR